MPYGGPSSSSNPRRASSLSSPLSQPLSPLRPGGGGGRVGGGGKETNRPRRSSVSILGMNIDGIPKVGAGGGGGASPPSPSSGREPGSPGSPNFKKVNVKTLRSSIEVRRGLGDGMSETQAFSVDLL